MNDRALRSTAAVCVVAVLVHGADHLRRGTDAVTSIVRDAGGIQFALVVAAAVLVFRRHRWAPLAAVAVGLPSAFGFVAVHLLPHWSSFSDAFTGSQRGPDVNALSWFAALFEIAADVAFGCAGLAVLRRRGIESAAKPVGVVERTLV